MEKEGSPAWERISILSPRVTGLESYPTLPHYFCSPTHRELSKGSNVVNLTHQYRRFAQPTLSKLALFFLAASRR